MTVPLAASRTVICPLPCKGSSARWRLRPAQAGSDESPSTQTDCCSAFPVNR